MSTTVDVNVLVHAINRGAPRHRAALGVIEDLAGGMERFTLLWPVVLGFVRITTHPSILPSPLAPQDAIMRIDELLALPHVRVVGEGDDPAGFWQCYRATQAQVRGGNDVPDAHLAALMLQHGVRRIYTDDRGFRRFDGIDAVPLAG
ncbi:MAG: PIN domain-containing protein [Patulibacter sp.]